MNDSQQTTSSMTQYCLAVGYISTTWAALERSIDELTWELAGTTPEMGACITAQMIGPGPRLKALLSLVREWKTDEITLAKFHRFAKSVESLGAKRNRYAHDTVHISLLNGYLVKNEITAAKQLRFLRACRQLPATWPGPTALTG
jgi:hypothetical protein